MALSDSVVAQLKYAHRRYSSEFGKHEKSEALEILNSLKLDEESRFIVEVFIDEWNSYDTFAGFGRLDGVAMRIQIWLLREGGVKL